MDEPSNIPEFTVSEISGAVKRTLEGAFGRVRVRGEITELKKYPSGHMYFSLKDEGGKIAGVVWKTTVARLGLVPENGVEVIAQGRISAYGDRSTYQLVVDRMSYAGVGALLARIEMLRTRLAAEGLFDADRKRAFPLLPLVIGLITSESGAVIQDIRTTIQRRFPRSLLLWPVPVQGEGAAAKIAAAIEGFNALVAAHVIPRPDVLIVARGGGSLEDLMAFNEEVVLRAVASGTIPLISAVGHETDTTLIDHVSDRRAPTPTAAAEFAVPSRVELAADLGHKEARLLGALDRLLKENRLALQRAERGLPDLPALVGSARQRLDDRAGRLARGLPNLLVARRAALERAQRGMPDLPALVAGARQRLDDRAGRLTRGLPNLLIARRAALERAQRGMPDLSALVASARQRFEDRSGRLLRALPSLLMARRTDLERTQQRLPDPRALIANRAAGLALSGEKLRSALRLAISRRSATAARVLPRLTRTTLDAKLRESRARLEGLGARLESVSYTQVLARGYALITDADGAPVTAVRSVRPGMDLRLRFADGEARAIASSRGGSRQGQLL